MEKRTPLEEIITSVNKERRTPLEEIIKSITPTQAPEMPQQPQQYYPNLPEGWQPPNIDKLENVMGGIQEQPPIHQENNLLGTVYKGWKKRRIRFSDSKARLRLSYERSKRRGNVGRNS